jgi:hypothetical protein
LLLSICADLGRHRRYGMTTCIDASINVEALMLRRRDFCCAALQTFLAHKSSFACRSLPANPCACYRHPVAKTKAEETVRQKAVTPGPHPEEENS